MDLSSGHSPNKQATTVIHHVTLADEFGHGFSCFVWYVCGGENGTNGHHLAVFSTTYSYM